MELLHLSIYVLYLTLQAAIVCSAFTENVKAFLMIWAYQKQVPNVCLAILLVVFLSFPMVTGRYTEIQAAFQRAPGCRCSRRPNNAAFLYQAILLRLGRSFCPLAYIPCLHLIPLCRCRCSCFAISTVITWDMTYFFKRLVL